MSNIEDLRKNNINSTQNTEENDGRVNIGSMANKKPNTKTVSNIANSDHRVILDMTQIGKPDPTPENINIQEDLATEILEGENSMFEQYRKNKKAEMEEMAAQNLQDLENEDLEDDEIEDINPISSPHTEAYEEEYTTMDDEDVTNIDMTSGADTDQYDIDDVLDEEDSPEDQIDDTIKEDIDLGSVGYPYPDENKIAPIDSDDDIISKPIEQTEVESEEDLDTGMDDTDLDVELADAGLDLNIVEEEEEQEVVEDDRDAILENLKKLATDKLKPASKKLDISSFTVLKKPSSNTKLFKQQQVKAAKWVLPGQNNVVLMKEFLGSELEDLREYSEDPSELESLSKRYRLIYDHIASSKPATFEAWLKSVPFSDVQHYIFAIYIASFKGVNYLPAECTNTKCKETFLTDNINIMSMVKFDNEKAKNDFVELYNSQPKMSSKAGIYNTEVVPLSNRLAVSFKVPTIYSLFEIASLSDRAKEKFNSILEFVPYIDNVYMIDVENATLIPCGYKTYGESMTKTVVSKMNMINKMFKTLTIDEYSPIRSYVSEIDKKALDISYIFPEITCPKCGTKIPEQPATSEDLVFTRYQLGALVNTPLK